MPRDGLAGREPDRVSALEIARCQTVKGLDLDVAGERQGHVHDGAASPAIDLPGALRRRAARVASRPPFSIL
jgi:hypothetical protein